MSRYRFLLSFRWILLTTLVAIAVVVMVRLGFWQVERLHTKQASNALITSRQANEPVPFGSLLPVGVDRAEVGETVWRTVTVTGTYRPDDQVLIRNRSNNTAPGFWVMTPLVGADGQAVAVNRGWVPITVGDGGSPDLYAPPSGEVTVTGLVQAGEHQQGLEAADPNGSKLTTLSRVDLDRYQQQVAYPLAPAWVQLTDQKPLQSGVLPVKVSPPPLDEGPHLNYAGQWFIYATLTVIVYPMAIRRAAKAREAKARQTADDAEHDDVPVAAVS